jgi:hypothetical protein
VTTSERQCGIAIFCPIPVEPRVSRRVRFLVELEQPHQLLQDGVLRGALEIEIDRISGKELAQLHGRITPL